MLKRGDGEQEDEDEDEDERSLRRRHKMAQQGPPSIITEYSKNKKWSEQKIVLKYFKVLFSSLSRVYV